MLFYITKEIHNAETPFDVESCDLVTFQYCKNKINNTDFTLVKPHITSIIDLTQPIEMLWKNLSSSTKTNINKAKREQIIIQKNTHYDEAYEIYKTMLNKKKFAPFHGVLTKFGIGAAPKKILKKHATLFTAHFNQEAIVALFFLESKKSIHFWLGGSKRFSSNKEKTKRVSRANRLTFWHAMKYAKNKNIKEFDLGGIFTDEEVKNNPAKKGIKDFKMQFGGTKITRYQYQKIYSKSLNKLYSLYNELK